MTIMDLHIAQIQDELDKITRIERDEDFTDVRAQRDSDYAWTFFWTHTAPEVPFTNIVDEPTEWQIEQMEARRG